MDTELSETHSSHIIKTESDDYDCSRPLDFMRLIDFQHELKMICDMFAGLTTLLSRGKEDKHPITVADYKELKLYIS